MTTTTPLRTLALIALGGAALASCSQPTDPPPAQDDSGAPVDRPSDDARAESEPPPTVPRAQLAETVAWLRRVSTGHAEATLDDLAAVESVRVSSDYESEELALLANLPALREVIIWRDGEGRAGPTPRAAPTDEDLAHIARLDQLRSLTIGGWSAPFTDEGLRHLARHATLESLRLTQAQEITDAGMEHVAAMKALQTVYLTYTNVTDVGLAQLLASATLRDVEFGWAAAAKASLRRFQTAHPDRPFLLDE